MFTKSFLKKIAKKELVSVSFLEKQLKSGLAVIPLNKNHKITNPCAIGEGLKVKINTNIGLSPNRNNQKQELKKALCAIKYGADTIMDLSVNKSSVLFRKKLLKESSVPLGTVPIYEAALKIENEKKDHSEIKFSDLYEILEQQAKEGVDFFTIHAGLIKKILPTLQNKKRLGGVVSRGGAILTRWMLLNKKENPFYENFDKILELAKKYRITMSLGDGLRPGAIADSTDKAQILELKVLGDLVLRCRKKGVQVMVEGPGHIRYDEIPMNMQLEKEICHKAPFYVLGPLPTDIAAGYDHITSAIGGAVAAFFGADFLCVVTPAEHLRHPDIDDIKDGTIASKIASHCINVLRFKDEWKKDYKLSQHRARRNWQEIFPLTLDEKKAKNYRNQSKASTDICSMCGNFCSLKIAQNCALIK